MSSRLHRLVFARPTFRYTCRSSRPSLSVTILLLRLGFFFFNCCCLKWASRMLGTNRAVLPLLMTPMASLFSAQYDWTSKELSQFPQRQAQARRRGDVLGLEGDRQRAPPEAADRCPFGNREHILIVELEEGDGRLLHTSTIPTVRRNL